METCQKRWADWYHSELSSGEKEEVFDFPYLILLIKIIFCVDMVMFVWNYSKVKSNEIKKVEFVHEDEDELHANDKGCDDSFFFLTQVTSQTVLILSYLSTPLTMNIVELKNAIISSIVWISSEAIKQKAVTGKKLVRLYPYMHINYVSSSVTSTTEAKPPNIFTIIAMIYGDPKAIP